LIIDIHEHEGVWDAHPSPKENRSALEFQMRRRISDITIKGQWKQRKSNGAPDLPHYLRVKGHAPLVLYEGEVVRFVSEQPFIVWVGREPNIKADPSGPTSAFGWREPQRAQNGNPFSIEGIVRPGAAAQRFYKFTAWVLLKEDTVLIDPDVICDR
jgi:hypothetical protein